MSATMTAVPPRAEVPVEETWALETVFATDDAWEEAFDGSGERLRAVETFRGRVGEGPATLLAALRAADDLTEAVWKVVVYALLRRSEDATNTRSGEMADRAIGLASRAEAAGSFLGPEIAAVSDETIADWIGQEPGLEPYRHALTRITRLRAHIRSVDAYLAFRNTFAATLAGAVKRDVFYARARGYNSSLEAALAGDNIPTDVFYNLLDTVWKHFPVWHRYFNVRRRLLGLPP